MVYILILVETSLKIISSSPSKYERAAKSAYINPNDLIYFHHVIKKERREVFTLHIRNRGKRLVYFSIFGTAGDAKVLV